MNVTSEVGWDKRRRSCFGEAIGQVNNLANTISQMKKKLGRLQNERDELIAVKDSYSKVSVFFFNLVFLTGSLFFNEISTIKIMREKDFKRSNERYEVKETLIRRLFHVGIEVLVLPS